METEPEQTVKSLNDAPDQHIKSDFRKKAILNRDSIDESLRKEKDRLIREALFKLGAYKEADTVGFYYSYKSEVDTIGIIERALKEGKTVCLPKVLLKEDSSELFFFKISSLLDVKSGFKGICEPDPDKCAQLKTGEEPDLLIVPGTAFDKQRNRMGYGKGFYDRYLMSYGGCSLALAYSEQIYETVPVSGYDRKPDMILTDEGII